MSLDYLHLDIPLGLPLDGSLIYHLNGILLKLPLDIPLENIPLNHPVMIFPLIYPLMIYLLMIYPLMI